MNIESREIIERIRLAMPLVVQLPDPITGEPFTVNRDNMLALLVIDVNNLTFEAQTVAALYAEAARIRAAAYKAHQEAEVRFRKWKSAKRAECRSRADKKPNKEDLEDFYRLAPDYEERYQEQIDYAAIVSLADDLKKAFDIKARALNNLSNETFGHNRVQNASDRITEVELERLAMQTTEQSGAAAAAADFREQSAQPTEDNPEPKQKPKRRPASSKGKSSKGKSSKRARPIGDKK
jgi:hypothetical protein